MTRVTGLMLAMIVPIVCGTGCLDAQPNVARMKLDADIVQVKKFYSAAPWLSFDEAGDPNPEGFKVAVYLISAQTGKGAFGDGDIEVVIYSHPKSEIGKPPAKPVVEKKWVFSPEDAMPYRVKIEAVMGFSYGLRLSWGDVDLLGKTVSVNINFRRRDGRLIQSSPKWLRVPPRFAGY